MLDRVMEHSNRPSLHLHIQGDPGAISLPVILRYHYDLIHQLPYLLFLFLSDLDLLVGEEVPPLLLVLLFLFELYLPLLDDGGDLLFGPFEEVLLVHFDENGGELLGELLEFGVKLVFDVGLELVF